MPAGGTEIKSNVREKLGKVQDSWKKSGVRELLTVQAHVMEGEDGRPAGGSCAVEGHVQDTMWGLDTVLLERGEGPTNPECDTEASGVSLQIFLRLFKKKILKDFYFKAGFRLQ